jgi:hypothetical protein
VRRDVGWHDADGGANMGARFVYTLLGLGQRAELLSYQVAGHHPHYDIGQPHPDDRAAFRAVARLSIGARASSRGTVELVDRCVGDLSDGLCLIGSPEAEVVTRLVFDYAPRADGQDMHYRGATVDLPYRWEEDATKVRATYSRYVEGRGRVERPNWPIVDQRGSSPRSIFPTVANDGLLATDLLLITKVPNFLSMDAFERGRSILSIAGTHGTATRAIEVFLRDRAALSVVARALRPTTQAFQILVEASDILHSRAGSRARSVRVLDVHDLTRPDAHWRAAHARVTRNFADWRAQSRVGDAHPNSSARPTSMPSGPRR